jgi:hypothetical protein
VRAFLAQALVDVHQRFAAGRAGVGLSRRAMWREALRSNMMMGSLAQPPERFSAVTREAAPIVRLLWAQASAVGVGYAHLPTTQRQDALVVAWASVFGDVDLEGKLQKRPRDARMLLRLERAVLQRSYLTGSPLLGLLLHFAWTAIDARSGLELTADVLAHGSLRVGVANEQRAVRARARRATLIAIGAITCCTEDAAASDVIADTVRWQLHHAGLPRAEALELTTLAMSLGPTTKPAPIHPSDARMVYRHAMLAARVLGRVSGDERRVLQRIAAATGLSAMAAQRLRSDVLRVHAQRAQDFDAVALAGEFELAHRPWLGRLQSVLRDNLDALVREVRETGDLAVLLTRRARGHQLATVDEQRMRAQLVDVAKAVPALALLTMPGGFFLLPLLLRILPFDLRPKAFADLDEFHTFAADDHDAMPAIDIDETMATLSKTHSLWRRLR